MMPLADNVRTATAVTVSNNRKYFACVEEIVGTAERCQAVAVYSSSTGKRVRSVPIDDPQLTGRACTQVVTISFRCGYNLHSQHISRQPAPLFVNGFTQILKLDCIVLSLRNQVVHNRGVYLFFRHWLGIAIRHNMQCVHCLNAVQTASFLRCSWVRLITYCWYSGGTLAR